MSFVKGDNEIIIDECYRSAVVRWTLFIDDSYCSLGLEVEWKEEEHVGEGGNNSEYGWTFFHAGMAAAIIVCVCCLSFGGGWAPGGSGRHCWLLLCGGCCSCIFQIRLAPNSIRHPLQIPTLLIGLPYLFEKRDS